MARRRRGKEEARAAILHAAEELLIEEGPEGVRLAKVAARVGISHPGVLHHFGSADALLEDLAQQSSRRVREALLSSLRPNPEQGSALQDRAEALLSNASAALQGQEVTRLLAWLLAVGRDPFPPEEEQGLSQIADVLMQQSDHPLDPLDLRRRILLGAFVLYGEALLGSSLRARIGLPDSSKERADFRRWALDLMRGPLESSGPRRPSASRREE